jgi:hypothetical protein
MVIASALRGSTAAITERTPTTLQVSAAEPLLTKMTSTSRTGVMRVRARIASAVDDGVGLVWDDVRHDLSRRQA